MNKFQKIVKSFVNAKNEREALRCENKLLIASFIPILIFVAVLNTVLFTVFRRSDLDSAVINSAVFVALAGALFLFCRFVRSERLVAYFITAVFIFVSFFVMLRFYHLIGPAAWTALFIMVVFATLSNNRLTFIVLSLCIAGIGIFMWIKKYPYETGSLYYTAQFIALAVMIVVSSGMLSLNIERYKKIRHYLNETEMIAEISADLITVNADNLNKKVNTMLERSSTYLDIDRAVIVLLDEDKKKLIYSYEWYAQSEETQLGKLGSLAAPPRAEWINQLQNKKEWIVPDTDKLDENTPEKNHLRAMNVKAMISKPFDVRGRVHGILFYASHTKSLKWTDAHLKTLDVLTNLLSDTFQKVEAEQAINTMAYYDALTGLPNRAFFNKKLEQAITQSEENQTKTAVVFIDLDSFKAINDTTGHEGGDTVLKLVGQRLVKALPEGGVAARFGGDEFILMMPDIKPTDDVKKAVETIMSVFTKPLSFSGVDYYVIASAGVAIYPEDGAVPKNLIKNADRAMYAAKELGSNQTVYCTGLIQEDDERKIWLMNQLYKPQLEDELVLDYQPLVDLETKEIVGFESLLRWNHPELGLIKPFEFIPLAEQTGNIMRIGEWVLRESCRQNKAWQDAGYKPVRIAVNLSIKQFLCPDLVGIIKKALADSGLQARYLELEITESTAVNHTCGIPQILREIKALGVTISIDDFGTEYSSLSRITQMPIDRIKMAMQFVSGISVNEKDETIAKIIINLASGLGLKLIAEGVETKTQFDFLKQRVCDEVQGFYLYKPMPPAEIEKTLKSKQAV